MVKRLGIIKGYLACLFVVGGMVATFSSAAVHAQGAGGGSGSTECSSKSLTFPAWYDGLAQKNSEGDCEIQSPTKLDGASDDKKTGGFAKFIWTIVLNIIEIMLQLVGYAAVGYVIYGGYKYIYSAGSPDGMVSARKTIMNAVIGLILSIMAVGIVNVIAGGL
jgi:hypothetical protein